MPRGGVLSYEEIYTVVKVAAELGITKVRLSGGEPLVRAELAKLVAMLAQIEAIDDVSLTTNGVWLKQRAAELKDAGLRRVNVSLDSLRRDRFEYITRSDNLGQVLEGIEAAKAVGLRPLKINMVVMGGINDDELLDFARQSIEPGWHVRFIELMPFAQEQPAAAKLVPLWEMKERLGSLGTLEPCLPAVGNGPAKYFRLPGARGTIGFITPVSEHFCFSCNRLRLTADGGLRPCLLADDAIDLRWALRGRRSLEEVRRLIQEAVASKPERHRLGEGLGPRPGAMAQIGG
jgi:cyclic pyranopterin phosphate synthase